MAWLIPLSIQLAVLIRTVLTDQDIKDEGDKCTFYISNDEGEDYCLMFRSSAGESLLLWNTSNPVENSSLAAEFRDRLVLEGSNLYINNLTQSDSGRYRMECWTDGRVSHRDSKELLVCSGSNEEEMMQVNLGQRVELQCEGTREDANMTVRWFREDENGDNRVQLAENSSSLHITNITIKDLESYYWCMGLGGQLCVYSLVFNLGHKLQYVTLSVGEEAVLPCFNPDDPNGTETRWDSILFGYIRWVPSHLTSGGKQMYLTDGRTSGNYSLVIPSLMLNHSGFYDCQKKPPSRVIISYCLMVCPKSEPLEEFFSEGGEVSLTCSSDFPEYDRLVWYRNSTKAGNVILDTRCTV